MDSPFAEPGLSRALTHVLDEDAWEDLLNYIEEQRVIPIVGPELLTVATESGTRPLYEWLAEKLAARLNVDAALLPRPLTLNDVVCAGPCAPRAASTFDQPRAKRAPPAFP